MRTRAAWRVPALLVLACILGGLVGGCAQIPEAKWQETITQSETVVSLLDQGQYDQVQPHWAKVDKLIHAINGNLAQYGPELRDTLWQHMALVELGMLSEDWDQVKQAAAGIPDLLRQAHDVLTSSDGDGEV